MYPPTNSVALLVDTLNPCSDADAGADTDTDPSGIPRRAVLKLADRRFGGAREADRLNPAWPWTLDVEREFQAGLRGYIQAHGRHPDLSSKSSGTANDEDEDEDEDEEEPTWIRELGHWQGFQFVHQKEKAAYSYLEDAQARGYIPRCFGAVRIDMACENENEEGVHPSLDHIDGLLLEYIPGPTMGSLEPGIDISEEDAEEVSQKVLTLGRRLRNYGVTHNDVHSNNIILRAPSNDPVLIDWGGACYENAQNNYSAKENWESHGNRQDFEWDIRKVLGYGRPWHRYNTPYSNECREELAKEIGWRMTNFPRHKTPEELEKFYYRDESVPDENSGLMWRVKPNVKTRPIKEPFQPLP